MRRRILAAMVAVTALAVAVFAMPLAVAVQRVYRDEAVVRLEREAARAAIGVPATFATSGDPPELPASEPGTLLALYGADGRRVLGDGPERADRPVVGALAGRVAEGSLGGRIVVAVPVGGQERAVGAVRAALDQAAVTGRTVRAWLAMAVLGVGAVAVAAVAARTQARRLGRPVDALAEAAGRLGQGDFAARAGRAGVAEVDAVAAALDATAERLGRLLARERTFSEDVSHQLRTPLAGLRLRLEAAELRPDADRRRAIADALAEVDRLEATLDELLALARDAAPARGPLDVAGLLAELEQAWHGPLAAAGRPLRVLAAGPLPPVRASAVAVRQVLEVLVGNAAEHGIGVVTVRARAAAGGLAIEVADEGAGVVGEAERLFQRRAGSASRRGIGLALARSLAEAEGGRLRLHHPGPGPVFALLLPSDDTPVPTPLADRPPSTPEQRT